VNDRSLSVPLLRFSSFPCLSPLNLAAIWNAALSTSPPLRHFFLTQVRASHFGSFRVERVKRSGLSPHRGVLHIRGRAVHCPLPTLILRHLSGWCATPWVAVRPPMFSRSFPGVFTRTCCLSSFASRSLCLRGLRFHHQARYALLVPSRILARCLEVCFLFFFSFFSLIEIFRGLFPIAHTWFIVRSSRLAQLRGSRLFRLLPPLSPPTRSVDLPISTRFLFLNSSDRRR